MAMYCAVLQEVVLYYATMDHEAKLSYSIIPLQAAAGEGRGGAESAMPDEQVVLPAAEDAEAPTDRASQIAYVAGLREHLETIPDFSTVSITDRMSPEQEALLSDYCSRMSTSSLREQGVVTMFREDILDPHHLSELTRLLADMSGGESYYRWYSRAGSEYDTAQQDHAAKYLSREWEKFHVGHMRQRRAFHAGFMEALISGAPIDGHLAHIRASGEGQKAPRTRAGFSADKPSAERLYDSTDWLVHSVLSALALPPEQCDAGMKRRAVELWSQHGDIERFAPGSKTGVIIEGDSPQLKSILRLPRSMRETQHEQHREQHSDWQRNRIIAHHFRPQGHGMHGPDGFRSLLQERPHDYLQVVLLHVYHNHTSLGIRMLAELGGMQDDVKDIVFSPEASFNTVMLPPRSDHFAEPATLAELLEGSVSAQTQEAIIGDQRQRIQLLTGQLAVEKSTVGQLQEQVRQLKTTNGSLAAVVNAMRVHIPRVPVEETMLKYGISPAMNANIVDVVLDAIERKIDAEIPVQGRTDEQHGWIGDMQREFQAIRTYVAQRNSGGETPGAT